LLVRNALAISNGKFMLFMAIFVYYYFYHHDETGSCPHDLQHAQHGRDHAHRRRQLFLRTIFRHTADAAKASCLT
jgi:hypothetical protein